MKASPYVSEIEKVHKYSFGGILTEICSVSSSELTSMRQYSCFRQCLLNKSTLTSASARTNLVTTPWPTYSCSIDNLFPSARRIRGTSIASSAQFHYGIALNLFPSPLSIVAVLQQFTIYLTSLFGCSNQVEHFLRFYQNAHVPCADNSHHSIIVCIPTIASRYFSISTSG